MSEVPLTTYFFGTHEDYYAYLSSLTDQNRIYDTVDRELVWKGLFKFLFGSRTYRWKTLTWESSSGTMHQST